VNVRSLCCAGVLLFVFLQDISGQDSAYIKVHFLYGSKPGKGYKNIERKWFGGRLGGHVGVEADSDQVLNFMKRGKVHWFASARNKNSRFTVHSVNAFWGIFRAPVETVKKTTVVIPISGSQKSKFDSISSAYLAQTPYDYAFFGMRCGAATYEILAQLDIVKPYSYRRTFMKIFYPRRLRKRLLKKATQHHWTVIRGEGVSTRNWERD
jgi:hypothetical protein